MSSDRGTSPAIEDAFEKSVARSRKEADKMLRRVRELTDAGQHYQAIEKARFYLRSFHAKLSCADEARRALSRAFRRSVQAGRAVPAWVQSAPTDADALRIAETLNVWRISDEPFALIRKAKRSGGYRTYVNFGLERRTAQLMIANVVRARSNLLSGQWATKPACNQGGLRNMRAAIAAAIQAGRRFAVVADISSFFDSIDRSQLPSLLKLPRRVIEGHLNASERNERTQTNHIPINHFQAALSEILLSLKTRVERGIPQGAAASTQIAEVVLADVLREFEGFTVFTYVDDVLILCDTRDDADLIAHTLRSSLCEETPGRGFRLKRLFVSSCSDGFDFCGTRIQSTDEGCVTAPTDAAVNRQEGLLLRWSERAEPWALVHDRLRNWRAQFPHWPDGEAYRELVEEAYASTVIAGERCTRRRDSPRSSPFRGV